VTFSHNLRFIFTPTSFYKLFFQFLTASVGVCPEPRLVIVFHSCQSFDLFVKNCYLCIRVRPHSLEQNQRKDDYLSSLNRLKEKAIRSKFPLNMTNDMIALAFIWEDRLRPPKCDKKEDPQVWATSFPHLLTLTQKEKKLNPKAMITYKRRTTIGQKLTNYKDLALNKTRKQTKGKQTKPNESKPNRIYLNKDSRCVEHETSFLVQINYCD